MHPSSEGVCEEGSSVSSTVYLCCYGQKPTLPQSHWLGFDFCNSAPTNQLDSKTQLTGIQRPAVMRDKKLSLFRRFLHEKGSYLRTLDYSIYRDGCPAVGHAHAPPKRCSTLYFVPDSKATLYFFILSATGWHTSCSQSKRTSCCRQNHPSSTRFSIPATGLDIHELCVAHLSHSGSLRASSLTKSRYCLICGFPASDRYSSRFAGQQVAMNRCC